MHGKMCPTRRGLVPSDGQYTWEPGASQMTVAGGGGRAGLGDIARLEVASGGWGVESPQRGR